MLKRIAGALAAGACLSAVAMAAAPAAAHAQAGTYNVPAGTLRQALDVYARQSGRQVIYRSDDVRGARSPGARGGLSADAALQAILSGTGFSARTDASGAVAIVRSGEADAGSAAAENGSAEGAATPEILVIGNPSLNADIRRTENDAQPYVVFSKDDIRRSGASSIDDFLRTRLTQNTQSQSAESVEVAGNGALDGNNGRINLRGLGTNQTLVLVDGRRVPGIGGFDLNQPNITGIPIGAIERIEVLPATAGAIYGGGAVGGVVNIILRRDYTGVELQADYGNTFDGATGDLTLGVAGGFHLGSTRISFSGSRARTADLMLDDRLEFIDRSRNLTLANNPAAILAATVPLAGATSNICASIATGTGRCNGALLVLDNGTPLNASTTFVPVGYLGPIAAGDGGAAFVANAGRYNLAPPEGISLSRGSRRDSFNVNVRQPVTNTLELFADGSWDRVRARFETLASLVTLLQANDPNNPFRQPIRVNVPLSAIFTRVQQRIESVRLSGGAILRLSNNWSMSLEQSWSRSRSASSVESTTSNAATRTLATTIATSDVNVVASPDFSAVLVRNLNEAGPIDTNLVDTVVRVSGSPFALPAGAVTLSVLAERRLEQIDDWLQALPLSVPPNYTATPSRRQRVESLYAESLIPIVSARNGIPAIRTLELQTSIRFDRYTTRSSLDLFTLANPTDPLPPANYATNRVQSVDFLIAGRYEPVRGLVLRASYSTGFLPPSLTQLNSTTIANNAANYGGITDPRRGNELLIGNAAGLITDTSGGNPDLRPEDSRSFSFGVIVEPVQIPGLRLSADYVAIDKRDEIIGFIGLQTILDNEDRFPGRITRGAPLPGDPVGYAGPVIAIDQTAVNVSRSRVRAWDFRLDYRFQLSRFGEFSLHAVGTRQTRFERSLLAGDAFISSLDFADGPLRWRGNLGAAWTLGGLSVSWNMQIYNSYRLCGSTNSASNCATKVANQGADRVPSQSYHDLYVRYEFGDGSILANTDIAVGINNLFNHLPPVIGQSLAVDGTYSPYGDPRLRRFVASLRRRF